MKAIKFEKETGNVRAGWFIEQQGIVTNVGQVAVTGEGILLNPCFVLHPHDGRESLETGRVYVRRLNTSEPKWYGIDNGDWKRPREIKAKARLKQLRKIFKLCKANDVHVSGPDGEDYGGTIAYFSEKTPRNRLPERIDRIRRT